MKITTAATTTSEIGKLTKIVYAFVAKQGEVLAAGISSPEDWEPVAEFIDRDVFKRIGAYLEVFDWPQYRDFLTSWAAGGTQFEFTEFRITEIADTVFQEIEERHRRGGEFIRKNVIAVYRFNSQNKLIHLDIYEQAQDSGQWIVEAAKLAAVSAL